MAPPRFSLPAPKTEAARASLQSFYCDLCQKGYSRQNEFAAHEASYEHNHNQRRKDLKGMNQAMSNASARARNKEDKEGGIKKLDIADSKDKPFVGGFKKGGFKSAFAPKKDDHSSGSSGVKNALEKGNNATGDTKVRSSVASGDAMDLNDSEDDYELYDPRQPTGCGSSCKTQEALA